VPLEVQEALTAEAPETTAPATPLTGNCTLPS
jgi:hypothetical protein